MRTKLFTVGTLCAIFGQSVSAGELGSVGGMLNSSVGGSVFATPLPHGPGTVPLPYPGGPMVAPVLLPVGAATAAPVAIYQYPNPFATTGPACDPVEPVAASEPVRSQNRFYASLDFLYGATQGTYLPPIVTSSPSGTPGTTAGALYSPNTTVLLGGSRVGAETRPGFRLNLGYWCNDERTCGFDIGFMSLGRYSEYYNGQTAPGGVILARPIVNGATSTNIGVPFGTVGPAGVAATFGTAFLGGDVNWRKGIGCDGKFDLLLGFRYLYLKDSVEITTTQGTTVPVPSTLAYTTDRFRSVNNFYGPQVGFSSLCPLGGGFSLEMLTKLAMGVTVADTNLTGSNVSSLGLAVPGGLLVGATNAGAYNSSRFAVVPEVGVKLGYDLTESLRLNFGYTMVYWSAVQRAPEQIDLTLFAPGRPSFSNRFDDVWVQGWTGGLAWKY